MNTRQWLISIVAAALGVSTLACGASKLDSAEERGNAEFAAKNYDRAMVAYDEAIAALKQEGANSSEAQARLTTLESRRADSARLGQTYFQTEAESALSESRLTTAEEMLKRLHTVNAGRPPYPDLSDRCRTAKVEAEKLADQARATEATGRLPDAVAEWDKAVAAWRDNDGFVKSRDAVKHQVTRSEQARADYEKALGEKRWYAAYTALGKIRETLGANPKALALLYPSLAQDEAVPKRKVENAEKIIAKARKAVNEGQFEEAENDLGIAASLCADHPDVAKVREELAAKHAASKAKVAAQLAWISGDFTRTLNEIGTRSGPDFDDLKKGAQLGNELVGAVQAKNVAKADESLAALARLKLPPCERLDDLKIDVQMMKDAQARGNGTFTQVTVNRAEGATETDPFTAVVNLEFTAAERGARWFVMAEVSVTNAAGVPSVEWTKPVELVVPEPSGPTATTITTTVSVPIPSKVGDTPATSVTLQLYRTRGRCEGQGGTEPCAMCKRWGEHVKDQVHATAAITLNNGATWRPQ